MSQPIPPGSGQHQVTTKKYTFAPRMAKTPKSFIREILKVTEDPRIISFAGGLPSPALIDVDNIAAAAASVLAKDGRTALQYSTTEGYRPLRQFIADRYRKRLGLEISPDEILITNGSQQCLDLLGKVLINKGDHIAIERPGYLGAIQAFSLYEPGFHPILLHEDGPDPAQLADCLLKFPVRFFYGIPNSQNPSGITYSEERRREIAGILEKSDALFIEDDAYGELNFAGKSLPSLRQFIPEQTIITGSFSKILAPGMRMGWVVAPPAIMEQLVIAKQASDLHSNYLCQRIAAEYLQNQNIDAHIEKIRASYRKQRDVMINCMQDLFPDTVSFTRPQGGMFIWVTLPEGISSMKIFDAAIKENVAVLPGSPFYVDGGGDNTLRINFSNSTEDKIRTGIERLASVIRKQSQS
ncbi:PLP-dependent aminotransferase family protein [uncultured Methanoregula sp.]|uniref:aminotransferase-like domain-containing protein n=1 Tax=uncultured Methanoregula sp. TaxID=1005933 RepID=UPI002AAB9250|nr:PLP-dependent aminotransferase family protein [uncultured Methanoregula sp.]